MENSVFVIIVNPRSDRLFNYWINGSTEKRAMLKERMRKFCLDLSPINARAIDKFIDDLVPFVLYVDQNLIQELEEEPLELPSKASLIFPKRKQVYAKTLKNDSIEGKTSVDQQKQKFNIWERYNIHIDNKKSSKKKKLFYK